VLWGVEFFETKEDGEWDAEPQRDEALLGREVERWGRMSSQIEVAIPSQG